MADQGLPLLAFLLVGTLLAVSSVFRVDGVTRPEGTVQDVILVFQYWDLHEYTPDSAYCVTGDLNQDLDSTLLPNNTKAYYYADNTGTYQEVGWNELTDVRAMTCSLGGKEAVAGPIIHRQATLTPRRLNVTLIKGESLRLPLNSTSRQVLWQKEPLQDSVWNKATLTYHNKLYIPSKKLQGSGIYLVIPEPAITPLTELPDEYGVFHLVVRECPTQRCGSDCTEWCPDCLNGGVCDARSCECVCPAGVTGHRCQTLCEDGYIGRNCTVPVERTPGIEVCVNALLGCTCAPGYSGEYCDIKCPLHKWGVDCVQTCDCWRYCSRSGCGGQMSCSHWGHCRDTVKKPCGEGDLGLPRLRQPPHVIVTSESANVSFNAWQQDYDDGELPSAGTLDSYSLQYWPSESTWLTKSETLQTPNTTITFNLTYLEQNTTYHLKVLVKVKVGKRICTDLRGRIHNVTFTTTCPNPPKPTYLMVDARTNSFDVDSHCETMSYHDKCDLQCELRVTSKGSRQYKTYEMTWYSMRVEGLEANTEYTVSLRTCYKNKKKCSAPLTTTKTTHPGEMVVEGQLQDDEVLFTWRPRSGSVDNLQFQTSYQIESRGNGRTVNRDQSRWNSETNIRIPVSPYTTVTLQVEAKNDEWETSEASSTVQVPPSEPGQVRNLRVMPSDTSLHVTWDEPDDNPPKGKLESFRVTWSVAGQTSTRKSKIVLAGSYTYYSREFTIQDLEHNTVYNITVEAKNEDVPKYGPAVTTTTTTTLGVPSQVTGLTAKATKSSLTLMWQPPETFTGVTTWYTVSLHRVDNSALKQDISVNETHAKLEGLSVAKNYQARVAACNRQHCGAVMELLCWTRPDPPRLQGSVDFMAASNTTITILLPPFINPPGWYWVMVKNEVLQPSTLQWKEKLKEDAEALVRHKNADNKTRFGNSSEQEVTDEAAMYITAKIYQDGYEELEVTVGDNTIYEQHYHNRPLKKDAAYWVVVVTEKWSGPYVERVTSVPQRFVAASRVPTRMVVWVILGLVAVASVVVIVVCLRKKRFFAEHIGFRMGVPAQQDNSHRNRFAELKSDHTRADLVVPEERFVPLTQLGDRQGRSPLEQSSLHPHHQGAAGGMIQEHIYANSKFRINRENLEAFLMRAVMSCETKIEFEKIQSLLPTTDSENDLPENHEEDRYMNNVTYDDTRVILPLYNNIPYSDYINANYVEGPTRPAAFIAAQGPEKKTVGAFWRMMWHTNCRVIVMMANLLEEQQVKVAQYWPEEQPLITEGVTITPTGVTVKMDFVKRTFTMSDGNTQKKIKQYQYTAWPNNGVPETPYGLAQMIKQVYREYRREGPITVHCGNGIGRTGTVILVMYLLDQLQARDAVNPSGALMVLRRGRSRLVENTEQYVFAHQLLHEVVFGLKTSFVCNYFSNQLSTLRSPQFRESVSPLQRQYQKLQSLPKHLSFKYGKDPACSHLNRNQDILPADERIVLLQKRGGGIDAQYLNVIKINGIDRKDAYLAGEHPQRHTLGKMWRLVYERKVAVWVLVHTFPDHDPEFPDVVCEPSALLGNMTLKASLTEGFKNFDERHVDISVTRLGKVITHRCLLISLKGWPAADCLPAYPEPLLSVIERAEAFSSHQKPSLFTCKDGVTGCGVMAALLLAVFRAKLFQEVDIYRSVASVQQDRPQFVVNLEQYDFLHDAMVAFLNSNNLYSNLK